MGATAMSVAHRIVSSVCLMMLSSIALACNHSSAFAAQSERYRIELTPLTERIVTGDMFSVGIRLCTLTGQPVDAALQLSAWMPTHNHGMNYRPVAVQEGVGRYRADGFLFHMPGQWQFVIDIDEDETIRIDTAIPQ